MSSCVLRNWVLLMCPLLPFRMNDEWCITEGNSINSLYLVALIKLCVIPPLFFFCILLTALGKDDVSRKWRCKHCISLELHRMKGCVAYGQIMLLLFYFGTSTNHPNERLCINCLGLLLTWHSGLPPWTINNFSYFWQCERKIFSSITLQDAVIRSNSLAINSWVLPMIINTTTSLVLKCGHVECVAVCWDLPQGPFCVPRAV